MNSQIFKKHIPVTILYDLLDKICFKRNNYYVFDMNSYKKMMYNEYHIEFLEILQEYYHSGKLFYLDRKLTYNGFTTILRQICKHQAVMYTSKINYNKSKYNIDYTIYFQ
jgi:hypothetical protein